jgi:hypothetical protein
MENKNVGIMSLLKNSDVTYSNSISVDLLKEVISDLFYNRVNDSPLRIIATSSKIKKMVAVFKYLMLVKRLKRQYGRKK